MFLTRVLRKIAVIAVFLSYLPSCAKNTDYRWTFREYPNSYPQYHTAVWTYSTSDPCKGLELELVGCQEQRRLYLNLLLAPVNPKGSKTIQFTYFIEDDEYQGFATVFVGGQRLLISSRDRDIILESLANHQPVRIRIGMYDQIINPE